MSRSYRSRLDLTGTAVALEILHNNGGLTRNPVWRGTFAPPDRMTLTGYVGNDAYEAVGEQVTPTYLVGILVDEMRVTVSPQEISGTFEGAFWLYVGPSVVAGCFSTQHTVKLIR